MKNFIKKTAACSIVLAFVCAMIFPVAIEADSQFGDWEKFYSVNKSIMQRHAHARQLMHLPIYRQSKNYTDGVACVQSILRYANYEFDIREDDLAKALNATEENGVKWHEIVNYLNAVRLNDANHQYFEAEKREHMTLDALRRELDEGHPVILAIQAWNWDENEEYSMDLDYTDEWECGHYVVAVGYDEDSFFFMDPSTAGNYTYIPKDKLVARWHDYGIDENNHRYDLVQVGIVVKINVEEPDGERYRDAFYGLM